MTGAVASFKSFAASWRPCPATIRLFPSTRICGLGGLSAARRWIFAVKIPPRLRYQKGAIGLRGKCARRRRPPSSSSRFPGLIGKGRGYGSMIRAISQVLQASTERTDIFDWPRGTGFQKLSCRRLIQRARQKGGGFPDLHEAVSHFRPAGLTFFNHTIDPDARDPAFQMLRQPRRRIFSGDQMRDRLERGHVARFQV